MSGAEEQRHVNEGVAESAFTIRDRRAIVPLTDLRPDWRALRFAPPRSPINVDNATHPENYQRK